MNDVVEVRLWGTTVGHLGYEPGQTEVAAFEYDERFTGSGIQISPVTMAYPPVLYAFDSISQRTFKGLPGVFADSLPDRYGNQLIDIYMAEQSIPPQDVTALDRLLYVGTRGMGALEYHPAAEFGHRKIRNTALDIHTLAELANMVTSRQKNKKQELLKAESRSQALRLIRVGSSAGGARSKALVAISPNGKCYDGTIDQGEGFSYWILKFDSENNVDRDRTDPKGTPRVEYIYSLIARACGIEAPRTDYLDDGEDFHFLIERFDRYHEDGISKKLHFVSWAGMAHADRDSTGAYSYEQLILLARELGLGQDAVTELYRRAVFNVIGRNQDDHTKNFGFLMNKAGEWKLSPAFDMTYAFDPKGRWTRVHQLKLNGRQDDFTRQDLVEFGAYCNLGEKKSTGIIEKTREAFSEFEGYAKEYALDSELASVVKTNLRMGV